MNRRQRRASGQRQPLIRGADLQRAIACPDCDSDLQPVEVAPGRYVVEVYHDPTCPWFQRFQRDGGYGVRVITTKGETE